MEHQLSELDLQLLHLYRELDPAGKAFVQAMAETLVAGHREPEKPVE